MSKEIVLSSSNHKSKPSLITCSAEIIASNVDLLTEILVRVPAKPLIRFKSVSKQWLSLISNDQFCRNHTQQNPSPPISGLCFDPNRNSPLSLNDRITRVSFHDDHRPTTLPNFLFLGGSAGSSGSEVLRSSNGLMLCTIELNNYVVCNLTTQRFVALPKLGVLSKWYLWHDDYLIYDPKKSPYYKVVVVSLSLKLGTSQFDVYSSESGSWKSTIATPMIPMLGQGAVWNGEIFLMGCGPGPQSCLKHDHFYFQFDIDAERLSTTGVPCPPYHPKGILYFGECGGHLLVIQIPDGGNATEFKVLEMKDGEDKFRWTVKYVVDLKPLALPRRSTCWFTVKIVRNVGANENDLAVVLCIKEGLVIQYNIKGKTTLKVLCDLAGGDSPIRISDSYHFIESLTPV